MKQIRVGFAMCGSFCTYERAFRALERLCEEYSSVTPIMSFAASSTDSRFGGAEEFERRMAAICGRQVIKTLAAAEPIGPRALLDVLVIAPCTGNTLGKLAAGISDTPVTLSAKAHARNGRPLVIAVSTNDGLSGSAGAIAALLNRKNVFFVPFTQDEPFKKPCSLVADFERIPMTTELAMGGLQIQPLLQRD